MNPAKILAILLIVGGGFALAYGGFSYTQQTHKADIGSLHMSVAEKHNVNVPVWAGLAVLVVGVLLLAAPRKA